MFRRINCDKRHDKWGGEGVRRLMRWRGVKDEDDIVIRKRNVGKEMRKKRI